VHSGTTRRQVITAGALALGSLAIRPGAAQAASNDGVSRSAESIHQEPVFSASRQRVYAALTDPRQFDQVIELSGVMKTMTRLKNKPSEISRQPGGAFALFGGYITGRLVAMVRDHLLVQAWRTGSWPSGVYSIARFELAEHESGARIIFDQAGFPEGEAESLAAGWQAHYWEPIQKLLS
jgi:activator of HSP90 ATPase